MSFVNCENLTLSYEGREVISDLTFHLSKGEYLCIVGENGSGKSTLIKSLLGFVKPSEGRISFDGISRNEIGYLPQQSSRQRDLPPPVRELVLSGCLNRMGLRPFYSAGEKARAAQNMEKLGIGGMERKPYNELSGGQQQRVLLARALCAAESLLVLDEPVTGLDPIVTADLYELILKLNREEGMTVIMVSHDVKGALEYADHILHLRHDGYFFGTLEEYRSSPYGSMLHMEGGAR